MADEVPTQHVYANIGFDFSIYDHEATQYVYANISPDFDFYTGVVGYIYANVDTAQPYPKILGSSPARARITDTATVYALGAGTSAATYMGKIQGQQRDGTWVDLVPTRWETIPASSDANTANRMITRDMTVVDPEHEEIDVEVPLWADVPYLPIRVVTEGP